MPTTIANSGSPQAAPAHTASLGRRGLLRASGLGVLVVALSSVEGPAALARAPNTLGNVTILATGGTIAGSGATSTTDSRLHRGDGGRGCTPRTPFRS